MKKKRKSASTETPLHVMDEAGILHTVEDYTRRIREEALLKIGSVQLPAIGLVEEEFAKLVRDGIATEYDFHCWRIGQATGKPLPQSADVMIALYERGEARMRSSVDRMTCPEGMTDLQHALLIAANRGAEGGRVANLTGDEKAMHLAKSIRKKSPCLSDRELADAVKQKGGSLVSNGVESLRKKIAAWVNAGDLPAKDSAPVGKSKTGKKNA